MSSFLLGTHSIYSRLLIRFRSRSQESIGSLFHLSPTSAGGGDREFGEPEPGAKQIGKCSPFTLERVELHESSDKTTLFQYVIYIYNVFPNNIVVYSDDNGKYDSA